MSTSINDNNNQKKHSQKRKRLPDTLDKKEVETSNIAETKTTTTICPYLDTVNRSLLDFDFEHSCSISLQSGPHIYGCLVCGKFFAGRGPQTPAYIHSVDENSHSVFVHLSKGTFHCLPDDYEIKDASLKDISAALHPTFSIDEICEMDQKRSLARDLFGKQYLPGFVGLNNLNKTDYINATVQALAHVRPLRDFFLSLGNPLSNIHRYQNKKKNKHASIDTSTFSPLAQCFGDLIRKMWSDKRFKSNVDPHMMIQAVSVASKKRFHIGKQAEAGEFMAWLLHHLHIGIGGSIKKAGSSIIHEIFQGKVEVTVRQKKKKIITNHSNTNDTVSNGTSTISVSPNPTDMNINIPNPNVASISTVTGPITTTTTEWVTEEMINNTHFLQLTLDIPEKPLFKDDEGGLVIPQEPLGNILNKFNGISFHDALNSQRRYRLKKLPNYLILHLARFKRNGFYMEKNPTIVAFPVTNLDLGRYVQTDEKKKNKRKVPTIEELKNMNNKELKKLLMQHNRPDLTTNEANEPLSKSDLLQNCIHFITMTLPQLLSHQYNLVANITHESPLEVGKEGKRDPLEEGSYKCHVQHKATGQWFEIQDLHVQETMPQLIGLSESYVLIYERKGSV